MSVVVIGMETSGQLRKRFQALGHFVVSVDLLTAEDGVGYDEGGNGGHIQGDVFEVLEYLWARNLWPDLGIFHPTCTNLTGSAEWAYADPDFDRFPGVGYHQRVKPETLTGAPRRAARERDLDNVRRIMALPIRRKVIENPRGVIGSRIRKATQIVQPYQFGDDASKGTCLWMLGKDNDDLREMMLPIDPAKRVAGRMVNGVERWSNQTDSGQNRLSPGDDRWKDRSRTYPGLADAMAEHWSKFL